MSRRVAALALVASLVSGCLSPPKYKTCAEFPLGTAGCPSACETWCDLMLEACPPHLEASGGDRRTSCLVDCGEKQKPRGSFGDRLGDSMACRIEHARLALESPDEHCLPATLEGGGTCVEGRCDVYCPLMLAHCPETYPDASSCLATCEAMPLANPDEASEADTLECRVRAARRAEKTPADCRSAEPSGGGVCGDPCTAYCAQIDAHCAESALYASQADCAAACALLPRDKRATSPDSERNTVECRLYHATYPAAFDPGKHCPHAAMYPSAHCGGECPWYCELMKAECPETFAEPGPEDDIDPCLESCAANLGMKRPLWPAPDAAVPCLPTPPASME